MASAFLNSLLTSLGLAELAELVTSPTQGATTDVALDMNDSRVQTLYTGTGLATHAVTATNAQTGDLVVVYDTLTSGSWTLLGTAITSVAAKQIHVARYQAGPGWQVFTMGV